MMDSNPAPALLMPDYIPVHIRQKEKQGRGGQTVTNCSAATCRSSIQFHGKPCLNSTSTSIGKADTETSST